jgi:hypothetical protein
LFVDPERPSRVITGLVPVISMRKGSTFPAGMAETSPAMTVKMTNGEEST